LKKKLQVAVFRWDFAIDYDGLIVKLFTDTTNSVFIERRIALISSIIYTYHTYYETERERKLTLYERGR